VALLAIPVAAQFGGFGGMQLDATALLANKGVQDELKLSDDQKKAITTANDELGKGIRAAFEEKDFAGIAKLREEHTKAIKKVLDKLDDKQTTRLMQIEVQLATGKAKNPKIFANEGVHKALKITSKQKETIKTTLSDMDKDFKEIDDDAKGDFKKMRENGRKKAEMRTEAYTKIEKTLDDDQKKDLGKLGGEKYEFKMEFPGFKDFGKKDKGKDDKKKDDF